MLHSPGPSWAPKMFDHLTHDFGAVARGAKAEHTFTLKNIYQQAVRIVAVRSSCGCTKPNVDKSLLLTWDESKITVVINTLAKPGPKNATVTVVFSEPLPAEVLLQTRCLVRGESFWSRTACILARWCGVWGPRKAIIRYAGRSDWRITRVDATNPHLDAHVHETARGGGQVAYHLWTDLKEDAQAGYFREQLVLVTDDPDARSPFAG